MRLLALVRKELLLLLRDPHALAVLFIMPTLFLVLMAGAMSNYLQDKPPALRLTLETPQASAYSEFFHAALAAQLPGSELLDHGDARSTRIDLPADFADTLLQDEQPGLALSFPPQLDKLSRQHLRGAVRIALAQTRLLAFLEDSGDVDASLPLAERLALVQQRTQSRVEEHELLASGDLSGRANASQLSVPAWLIFGMFFVALPMAGGFQREQQSGALLRFRALDLSLATLALSKLLPYLAINLVQFALLLAIGVYGLPLLGLQGLTLPGSPAAYLLLAISLTLATCGLGLLLAGLARSAEQALLLGGGINIILAALGGIMVPKSVMPAAMGQLAEISPMSWALDAFLTLLVGQGSVADIAPYCLRLLLMAALLGGGGWLLFRRRVQQTQWTTY
ncbi:MULTISPECIES: ABC transporter permease [unclassified Pseudomonas]|uniref:ABC transporter permease n=1 Tax=unclassified Pseudomonas TaxID=196821 RepID=UPI0024472B2B|nr:MULTISPECIES: ABC transporter permease [unclassified Pseudomonas]MDG9926638.1 ABC transporter permease [Pseudomonas sp. GD04042]MDH0482293.1 ABC transporter permease [Pseudomonas sp. GD04015]MDH0603728.1 ABC transporter permease [Pseudomonas sp. GD03869]